MFVCKPSSLRIPKRPCSGRIFAFGSKSKDVRPIAPNRIASALGKDVANWLANPYDQAMMGDTQLIRK